MLVAIHANAPIIMVVKITMKSKIEIKGAMAIRIQKAKANSTSHLTNSDTYSNLLFGYDLNPSTQIYHVI